MSGYMLVNQYGNKLMFGVLVPWFLFEILQRRRTEDKKSIIIIVSAGLLIFGSKALAYLYTGAVPNDILLRECVMIAINDVLWSAVVAMTFDSIRTIWRVLFAYALLRTAESGVGGLLVYFFPEIFYQYSYELLSLDVGMEEEAFLESKGERLYGFLTHDSVNTSVHLAVAISVLISVLLGLRSRKISKMLALPLMAVASTALVFTWSRTGWIGVAVFLLAFIYMNGRRIGPVLLFGAIVSVLVYLTREIVTERMFLDERLVGSESIELRFISQMAYLSNFQSYGLFGIGVARNAIPTALSLPLNISSEQCFIQAFAETGLIGGGAFIYFLVRCIYDLKTSVSACRGDLDYMKETGLVILGVFLIFLLQANTLLMTYNDGMFWFFGGSALGFKAIVGDRLRFIPRHGPGAVGHGIRHR